MPESWRTIPLNAGLLVAIAVGLAATVSAVFGVQSWVSDRINTRLANRVEPMETQLKRVEGRVASMRQMLEQRDDRYQRIEQMLEQLVENRMRQQEPYQ